MFGKSNKGFTLFQLLVALGIIGLLGAALVPNLRRENPAQERKNFVSELNKLMSYAWFNGVTQNKVQRIVFDFNASIVRLEQQTQKTEHPGQEAEYVPIKRTHTATSLAWPKHYEIKNFFIEGYDEAAKYSGSLDTTWFFLVPDGLTQDVILNIVDTKNIKSSRKGTPFSLVLNPFSAQFKEFNHFQNIK